VDRTALEVEGMGLRPRMARRERGLARRTFGAGKTTLVRAIVRGRGIGKKRVRQPIRARASLLGDCGAPCITGLYSTCGMDVNRPIWDWGTICSPDRLLIGGPNAPVHRATESDHHIRLAYACDDSRNVHEARVITIAFDTATDDARLQPRWNARRAPCVLDGSRRHAGALLGCSTKAVVGGRKTPRRLTHVLTGDGRDRSRMRVAAIRSPNGSGLAARSRNGDGAFHADAACSGTCSGWPVALC